MATAALDLPEEDQDDPITLADILDANNVADLLNDTDLSKIGQRVITDFDIDDTSRRDWLERYKKSLDIAMQVRTPKTFPWPKAANIKFPLLTVASIQFQARAYPAIVDGSNLVKGRVLGPDPTGEKRERADRIGQHMTWQLLYRMMGWEEETDKLLLMLPITGCVFRKTYYDPISSSNCSDMIPADDFVIDYYAKSIDSAPRYTQVLHLYPYEARERIAAGLWREVRVDAPEDADGDEDGLVDFYEQHRMIDLDEDGVPEPYVVTTTKDGEVARIAACFGLSDIYVKGPNGKTIVKATDLEGEDLQQIDITPIRIERQQYFTKYGFIPAPDGSFYDIGFGTLLGDLSATIDTTINQMLDAATLQNAQGGFIGAGVNIRSGSMKFAIGEWKRVDTGGTPIKDAIVPMATPGPSSALFQLLGMMIEAAKEITSVQDVLTGASQGQNTPATTVLAQIEQGQKVMTAIFKRVHRAFGNELRILRRLNRDHLNEQEYFQLNDEDEPETEPGQPAAPRQPQMVGRADYEDDDLDVVPVSDPTIVSDMQKMAKAQALMPFNGDPLVNQMEIRQRYFTAIGEPDIKKLLTVPPPNPDPKMLIDGMKTQIEKQKTDNATLTAKTNAAGVLSEAAGKLLELGLVQDAEALAGMATKLGIDNGNEPAGGPGNVPGMESPPADPGMVGGPANPPPGDDGSMGIGNPDQSGASGVGGPAEPVGGPVA